MEEVFVFGHKNPDTDSVCSAIAYAHLKKIRLIVAITMYQFYLENLIRKQCMFWIKRIVLNLGWFRV